MNIHTAAAVLIAMMTIGKIIFESIRSNCTLHRLIWLYAQTLDFRRLLAMHKIVLENPGLCHVAAENMVYCGR